MTDSAEHLKASLLKYNSYDSETWTKEYFDEVSGGFNVYHKEHNFSKKGGGGDAEKTVGKMLAQQGKQVEFLPEGGKKSPDIEFDNQKWDIKYIDNANYKTIRNYIEDIRRKKTDNTKVDGIFYWKNTDKIQELRTALKSEVGKLSKSDRINEMPDIYYMDENGILKLLWKK